MRVLPGPHSLPFPLSLFNPPFQSPPTFLTGSRGVSMFSLSQWTFGWDSGIVCARAHHEGAVRRQRPQSEIQGTAELP